MAFLKKNWQLAACILMAAAGIGVGVWQAMAATDVPNQMSPAVTLGRNLDSAMKQPMRNKKWIDSTKRQISEGQQSAQGALAKAEQRQRYVAFEEKVGPDGRVVQVERKPLVEGVLPNSTQVQPKIDFRTRYREEFRRLMTRIAPHGGAPADLTNIDATTSGTTTEHVDPWSLNTVPSSPTAESDQPMDRSRMIMSDPLAKKSLERAREILMYVDSGAIVEHPMANAAGAPSVEDIWQAQMSLWIQQDLVTALARVNEEAAKKLKEAGRDADIWVAQLPIKRLHSISIGPLLGGAGGGGSNTPYGTGGWSYPNFTARENDDKIFVDPLQVSVILEADALPKLLESLVNVSFIMPVRILYSSVPANPGQQGYIYGSQKLIDAQIDMEGYYLHSVFKKWMPPAIATQLSHPWGPDLAPMLSSSTGTGATAGGGGQPGGRPGGRP